MNYVDIYKICCKDANITDIYIGSSLDTRNRFYQHKNCCNNETRIGHNSKLYRFIRENGGIENWKYEILERIEETQQRIREQYWIDILNPSLNERRSFTDKDTAKEIRKKSEETKKDEIAQKKREWRQNPEVKEREREQAKIWRENNREKHLELTKEWRENNKAHLAEYAKQKYEENREKINARRRELYAEKKQCE
jgi:hypothetical protein